MVDINILHLSDLHFSAADNPALKAGDIFRAIRPRCSENSPILIAVTGDISLKGQESSYKIAALFFEELQRLLVEIRPEGNFFLISVPGNHDCDFSRKAGVRDLVLSQLGEVETFDDSHFGTAMEVQGLYRNFMRTLKGKWGKNLISECNNISELIGLKIGEIEIGILAVNTAWCSRAEEDPGRIFVPAKKVKNSIREIKESRLNLAMFHHPYGWFHPDNAREFRSMVEEFSDIVLTGHEHDQGGFHKARADDYFNEYVQGGTLSASETEASFNFLQLSFEQKSYRAFLFKKTKDSELFSTAQLDQNGSEGNVPWRPFKRSVNKTRRSFTIKDEFEGYLRDPGAGYSHPKKGQLKLDEIYIFPDLKEIFKQGKDRRAHKGQDIIDLINKKERLFLTGKDTCGKTALSKSLFIKLRESGVVPLLVKGEYLRGAHAANEQQREKLLKSIFSEQYTGLHEEFIQLAPEKRALIVDDFNKSPLTPKGRDILIRKFLDLFKKVIIISADDGAAEILLDLEEVEESILAKDFHQFEILPFGHVLRGRLIKKWYSLYENYEQSSPSRVSEADDAEKIINGLLGKNLVPSYPLFVLIFLQAIDSKVESSIKGGTYGPLYQYLIFSALKKISPKPEFVDLAQTLLTEFAYHLYQTNQEEVTESEFLHIAQKYKDGYDADFSPAKLLENLEKVQVIKNRSGLIRFCYPYYFSYFVAVYFAQHINEPESRARIPHLAENCHRENFANILLFLCSLSKDEYIWSNVVSAANNIFLGVERFNLLASLDVIGGDSGSSGRLSIDSRPAEERREHFLQVQDEMDLEDGDDDEFSELEREPELTSEKSNSEAAKEMKSLMSSFRMVQVLGQILGGSPGSLKSDVKKKLAQAGYDLTLRTAGHFVELVKTKSVILRGKLVPMLAARFPDKDASELKSLANSMIYGISQASIFGMIKHASQSLGHKSLKTTYGKLLQSSRGTSDEVLNISVQVDHVRPFPDKEVIDIYGRMKGYPLAGEMIRCIAWQHFYLFRVPMGTMQHVCSKLAIDLNPGKILGSPEKRQN